MSFDNNDDDFGGFEVAEAIPSPNKPISEYSASTHIKQEQKLPDWLLQQSVQTNAKVKANDSVIGLATNKDIVYQLQDELTKTKEKLSDQQTKYLEMQTIHRQEIDDTTNAFNNSVKEFNDLLKQSLAEQREASYKEFRILLDQQAREYDLKLKQQTSELEAKLKVDMNNKLESQLTVLQEQMIFKHELDLQDMEVKVRKIIREEQMAETMKLRQNFEQIEKEFKSSSEKYVQNYFKNQSEIFKEQIKAGIQQEHLIHKDLINNKLEKLLRSSEEKRRSTNVLFNRHMSGLNFFIENAYKQMSFLNQAQNDLLKNKDIVDYYGDVSNTSLQFDPTSSPSISSTNSEKPVFLRHNEIVNDESLLDDLA